MKNFRKIFVSLIVVLLVLSGCSSSKSKSEIETDPDGTKVFTAFFAVPGVETPEDSKLYRAVTEKIGARAKVTWLTGQTAKERIGTLISGGEYPDFVDASDGFSQMIDAKAFVPLEDHLDDYPNLKGLFSDLEWEKIKEAQGGHIYTIPQFSSVNGEDLAVEHDGEAFWIQKKVLEWADWPELKTVYEYFDLIEKYLEAHPTTEDGQKHIGFEILTDDWRYFTLENPPMFLAGYPNDGAAVIDPDTLEASVYDRIPEAKEYFGLLAEMYDKGIIDPEAFTANYDQYIAKLSSGRVLGMIDQGWQFMHSATPALVSEGKYESTWVPFGLSLDPNVETQYGEKKSLNTQGGVGITVSCVDVEAALQFLDDLVSEEVMILRNWGILDEDYHIDENGKFYRTEEQRERWRDKDYADANLTGYSYFPSYVGYLPDGINAVNTGEQPDEYFATLSEYDQKVLNAYGHTKWTDFVTYQEELSPWFPIYTERNSWTSKDPAGIISQQMDDLKKRMLPMVVMGGSAKFEENWQKYMDEYEATIDYETYEDTLTEEVKRRVEIDKELRDRLGIE